MSQRINTNARGRQSQTAASRGPQIRLTFGGKSGTKNGAKKATTIPKSTKKRKASSMSDVESTTSGGVSAEEAEEDLEEESDDADDESEDPEVPAPSHYTSLRGGAGPYQYDQEPDNLSEAGEWAGFPEPESADVNVDLVVDEDFERRLFDSDDDLVYERVNEVSDSDNDDDEAIERAETELLAAEFDDGLTSHFANQIDGMSAYGFGDDSEEEGSMVFPFSSGDEANEAHDRHVHFEEHPVGVAHAFAALGDSPTMTRALLPSALPDTYDDAAQEEADEAEDHDYDCM